MPVEHSLQYNYWCYALIKLHLKEQFKFKVLSDIALIAYQSDLNVF